MYLYHGTDIHSALDIFNKGIDFDKTTPGYFGKGFYLAEEFVLSYMNYSGEDGGVVVFEVNECCVLDGGDFMERFGNLLSSGSLDQVVRSSGVDACKDASIGGFCFYNDQALKAVAVFHNGKVFRWNEPFNVKKFEAQASFDIFTEKLKRCSFEDVGKVIETGMKSLSGHLDSLKRFCDIEGSLNELKNENYFAWTCIEPAITHALKSVVVPPRFSS